MANRYAARMLRLISLLLLFPVLALAGQGVPAPYVKPDHRILVTDGFARIGEPNTRNLRKRLTYDSAQNEMLMLRRRVVMQDDRTGDFGFEEVELAAIAQLSQPGDYWLDLGLYGGVHLREDEVGWTGRLLIAKRWDEVTFRSNLLLRNEFGEPGGDTRPEFRFRISKQFLEPNLSAGIEYFGRYGTVNHVSSGNQQAGPVIVWNFMNRQLYTETGAVFGLTDETETALVKWRVGWRF